MYWNKDKIEAFPDLRDPITGDYLPMSQSDVAKIERAEHSQRKNAMSNSLVASMLTSILK